MAVGNGSQASGTHGPLDLGEGTKKKKKPAEKGTQLAAIAAHAELFGEKWLGTGGEGSKLYVSVVPGAGAGKVSRRVGA